MKIYQQSMGPARQDAFWYGGEIAKTSRHILITSGDIRVVVGPISKAKQLKDEDARQYALDHDWVDEDIDEKFCWERNSWFEILEYEKDEDGTEIVPGGEGGVYHEYDEAIEELKELAKGD